MKFFDASRYASPLRKALAKKENAPRNLRFETLENRALLSVTPLDELQAAVASAEIAPAQTVETPVVDLSALAVSNATAESGVLTETEPNDTFDAAQDVGTLTETTTLTGEADASRKNDYFTFKIEFPKDTLGLLRVDGSIRLQYAHSSTANLQLTLQNANGVPAATTTGTNGDRVVSFTGLPAGDYYVLVKNSTPNTAAVPYTLTFEPTTFEVDDDDYEENDSLENAKNLGMVGSLELDLKAATGSDDDYFKFTTTGSGTDENYVAVEYEHVAGSQDVLLQLYDGNGTALADRISNAATGTETVSLAGLPAGDYYIRVHNHITSATVSVPYKLTIEAPKVAPVAPTTFATNGDEATFNHTTLSWNNVDFETGYEIRYTTDVAATDENAVWSEIQTVGADVTTFDTGALAYGTAYKFQLRAVNDFGQSAWIEVKFATVDAPEPPTGLKASVLAPETLTVELSWDDLDNELGYVVELLDADGAVVAQSDLLEAGTTTWTTPELALGTTYQFQVTAKNNAGDATSAPFEFTTENVPTDPTKLEATVNASTAPTATLKWDAVESDAIAETVTGYEVTLYQIEAGGTVVAFAPQTVADAAYTTGTLALGGTYYFEVAAVNAYGKSAVATSETFTVGTVPATPTDLTATVDKTFKATLTWSDAATNETGYRVELQTQNADGETDWTPVATLDAGATTWTSDALTSGETYRYRVVAFNDYGDGDAAETSVTLEAASTVVTTLADVVNPSDGWVSLREAIQYAEAGDVVTFDNRFKGGTISLHGTSLQIDKAITLDGSFGTDSPRITVDAYNQSGVFNVVAGTTDAPVAFVGLKITRGSANGGVVVANGSATFTNVEITGNKAFQGGGVHLVNSSATFTNVKIAGNEAERGGGVFAFQNSTATFTNVEIADNVATATGGGAFVYGSSSATFTNVAIVGNSATGAGGGVVLDGPSSATFTNATIAGNSAENGAAVLLNTPFFPNLYTATFYNSIVDGEIARGDSSPDARANAYNTLSTFTEWTNQATAETDGIYLLAEGDSLFAEGSYALAADSVALNKGDNVYVPETLTTDLAGNDRISGTNVDLGAYEFQGVAPIAPTGLTATVNPSTEPTATLKWDAAETVAGYEVTLYQIVDADGETTVVAFEPQTVTEATWTTPTLDFGGIYYFEVAAVNAYGKSEVATSDTFTVGDVPAQPTNLTATVDETFKATLTWIDATDNETGYVVEQLGADGAWTQVANLAVDANEWTTETLAPGELYAYRVVAVNDYAKIASETVEVGVLTAPELTAETISASEIKLTIADVANAVGYVVEYSTSADFPVDATVSVAATGTTTISDLDAYTTYYFRAIAKGEGVYADSDYSETVSATSGLAAPTDVALSQVKLSSADGTLLRMKWADVEGETGYRVEYREAGTEEWTAFELKANAQSQSVYDFTPGQTYEFRVRAENVYGASAWSTASITPMTAPTVEITAIDGNTKTATLALSAPANATQMRLEVSTEPFATEAKMPGADLFHTVTLKADATSATLKNLEPGATYYVRVRAINANGDSDWCDTLEITTPIVPTNLAFSQGKIVDADGSRVYLKWDRIENVDFYRVEYREAGAEEWSFIANYEQNYEQFKQEQVLYDFVPGATYDFRVRAEGPDGVSDWAESSFTTLAAPTVEVADVASTTFTLNLTAPENATKMRVEILDSPFPREGSISSADLTRCVTLSADAQTWTPKNLTPGATYYVRVYSINANGVSDWCDTLEITTPTETLETSNAVSDAFAELFADDVEDDFWFELESTLGKRK